MNKAVPLVGLGLLLLVGVSFQEEGGVLDFGPDLTVYSVARYLSRSQFRGYSLSYDEAQDLVESVKLGNELAISDAANLLAMHPGLLGFRGYVVPTPRSHEDRPSLEALAVALVQRGVGSVAVRAVWREKPVASSRLLRRARRPGVQPPEHQESFQVAPGMIPYDAPVLLVDDMITEGNTLRGAVAALRRSGHTGPIFAATVGAWESSPKGLPVTAFSHLKRQVVLP